MKICGFVAENYFQVLQMNAFRRALVCLRCYLLPMFIPTKALAGVRKGYHLQQGYVFLSSNCCIK